MLWSMVSKAAERSRRQRQDNMIHPCDGQTDRQTDGRAGDSIYAVARKNYESIGNVHYSVHRRPT